jgi:hypothetical protein
MRWKFNEILVEDYDDIRVFYFIKKFYDSFEHKLVSLNYRKGSLSLTWFGVVPSFWLEREDITINLTELEKSNPNSWWWDTWSIDHNSDYPVENVDVTRIINHHTRYLILQEQKWKCNICGCHLRYCNDSSWKGEVAHIDHIHPFSDRHCYPGRINERSNLQALCSKCNLSKHKKRG